MTMKKDKDVNDCDSDRIVLRYCSIGTVYID